MHNPKINVTKTSFIDATRNILWGTNAKNKQLQNLLVDEENGVQVTELERLETDEPVLTEAAELSLNSAVRLYTQNHEASRKDYKATSCGSD